MFEGRAEVCDFSREGIGLKLPKPVEQGEHMELTLKVPGDNVPILATAKVAWIEPPKNSSAVGKVGVGLRFLLIKPLDLARLLDFVYSRWLGGVKEGLHRSPLS
jgi:hypothetical protein